MQQRERERERAFLVFFVFVSSSWSIFPFFFPSSSVSHRAHRPSSPLLPVAFSSPLLSLSLCSLSLFPLSNLMLSLLASLFLPHLPTLSRLYRTMLSDHPYRNCLSRIVPSRSSQLLSREAFSHRYPVQLLSFSLSPSLLLSFSPNH